MGSIGLVVTLASVAHGVSPWEQHGGNCDSEVLAEPQAASIPDLVRCVRLLGVYRLDLFEVSGDYRERILIALRRVRDSGDESSLSTATFLLERLESNPTVSPDPEHGSPEKDSVERAPGVQPPARGGARHPAGRPETASEPKEPGKDIVYFQWAGSLVATNAFTLNYERVVAENVSLSLGVGCGFLTIFDEEAQSCGGEALVHFFFGGRSRKFEIALGASVFGGDVNDFALWGVESHDGVGGGFATFIGYRYQPNRGALFKVGLAWSMVYGLPLAVAFGAVF